MSPEDAPLHPPLRTQAEALLGQMPEDRDDLSPEAAGRALRELREHQIELELQNEELRQTQSELEISRERYFDLYDLAPVGYFTLSDRGTILEANLTAAKLLGVPRDSLISRPLFRFILADDQGLYYLHRKTLLETGVPQAWELRVLKSGASPLWVQVEATTAKGVHGSPVWRAVMSDISARKFAEREREKLEAQNRQLQKAEGLGLMAGAIAHHFNNHLTAVMGNLELALRGLPPGTSAAGNLTAALQAAHKAADLSALMLTYLGHSCSRHEPLDVSELCRQTLPLLRAGLPKDVALNTDLPSPGPAIRANGNEIQQVLTSLVTNAWEACGGRPGAIHLSVKTVSPSEISTSHRFPIGWSPGIDPYACLEVADAGCGIADGDLEMIFDPFFSSKRIGRGLGLPVVLGIMRAHGGAVTVESAPGKGSAFRIFLPVSAQPVVRRPDRAAEVPATGAGGVVLLVEDEPMVRTMAATALTSLGFKVLLAEDGVEALEVFLKHGKEIRCVVCDLTMPRMNGWETLTALRKFAPGLPVILASGYDKAQAMAGVHSELPQEFLGKPYGLDELRDAISRALAPVGPDS